MFTPLATFSQKPMADMAADVLREAGIPVLVQGPSYASGMFGDVTGDPHRDVTLHVPETALDDARDVIGHLMG